MTISHCIPHQLNGIWKLGVPQELFELSCLGSFGHDKVVIICIPLELAIEGINNNPARGVTMDNAKSVLRKEWVREASAGHYPYVGHRLEIVGCSLHLRKTR